MDLRPLYTAENCTNPAFQLDWSVTVFWNRPMSDDGWYADLQRDTETDGVRVLEHRFLDPVTSQLLVSTRPNVCPYALIQSVKGRLYYLLRRQRAKPFRNKYSGRSIGSATREIIEQYVGKRVQHHRMADPRIQALFARYQVCNDDVDLSVRRVFGTGFYWYNLHLAFVHTDRFREVEESRLATTRTMVLGVSAKYNHLLSRAGIVADHVHLTLGAQPKESPAEVALRYMNNLAFASGMKPIFEFDYFVGTFGEYNLKVIPRPD